MVHPPTSAYCSKGKSLSEALVFAPTNPTLFFYLKAKLESAYSFMLKYSKITV